jgi:hypothetical protein
VSVAHLFDALVRLWRPTTGTGEARQGVRYYAPTGPVPTRPNAYVGNPTARLGRSEPGLTELGERRLVMDVGTDIQPLDVVELVGGANAPALFEVIGLPARPRGNHVGVTLREWPGPRSRLVDEDAGS